MANVPERLRSSSSNARPPRPVDAWTDWLLRSRLAGLTDEERERRLGAIASSRDKLIDGARLRSGDDVLDAGCGTGLLALAALEAVAPDGVVTGLDISADALDELGRLGEALGQSARLRTVHGRVERLPFRSAEFDALLERSVLIYVDDKTRAISEYRRVLCAGGRLSLLEPINVEARHEYHFDLAPVKELHERVQRGARRAARRQSSMLDFVADDLVQMLQAEGYKEVRCEQAIDEWSITSGDEWRRRLDAKPNPLARSHLDLLRRTLGTELDSYVSRMAEGVDRGGYTFSCPQAYITAVA